MNHKEMAAKVQKRRSEKDSAAKTRRRINVRLSRFARTLLSEWKRLALPRTKARAIVAVSGGADSVALLVTLDDLNKSGKLELELFVAHLDHGLRKDSRDDARWVAALAKQLGYTTVRSRLDVTRRAARTRDNLEQSARNARYEFFANTALKKHAHIILTAHTLDDQAETVLLNLLRGSGAHGLGGIEPVRRLTEQSDVLVARPLLSWARRRDTEACCRSRGIDFRVDEMNADETFARVRVRRQLLPLMESFNPRIVEGLARAAELTRDDSIVLEHAAMRLLELSTGSDNAANTDNIKGRRVQAALLASAHPALRRRALRQWINQCRGHLRRLERVHILAVESLLFGERGGRVVELPGGAKVSRQSNLLEYID